MSEEPSQASMDIRDRFLLVEKPFTTTITLTHRKRRGPGLPDGFTTTTHEYTYLTAEEKRLVERTVVQSLLGLGEIGEDRRQNDRSHSSKSG
jgi:hypothetical protein